MVLNIDPKFEGKLTFAFKNYMNNLATFYHSTFESLKIGTFTGSFQSTKFMSSKFTGVLCIMIMNNQIKFEEKLTCYFLDPSAPKSLTLAL